MPKAREDDTREFATDGLQHGRQQPAAIAGSQTVERLMLTAVE